MTCLPKLTTAAAIKVLLTKEMLWQKQFEYVDVVGVNVTHWNVSKRMGPALMSEQFQHKHLN